MGPYSKTESVRAVRVLQTLRELSQTAVCRKPAPPTHSDNHDLPLKYGKLFELRLEPMYIADLRSES